jgi:hypothetical protein
MSSSAEAKLGALYTMAKEMARLRQTLIKMGWPQPRTPSKPTTQLPLASPTLRSSHKRPSPWTSAYGGSNVENPNISFVTTGKKTATIGQTTTPNTTRPSTTSLTAPPTQVQHAYYHLNLLPYSGTAAFSYQKNPPDCRFFSFFCNEHILGCHCNGVLFTYYLHTVRISTKLVTLLSLTSLLKILLLRYSSASRCT